ncbi:solute carrier family 50 (sugar transporter) [Trypanosoma rangeli]|uniref:Solute carrier family 50 (Sugar transporter) n=1 Tax=Trypanosoma rangeli TaxID=5698 RepID=A0A3R7RTY4_TRYRA|nr:solute carrier family 50 (sugar transporter) [Trypanosoma rangeli]RNF12911.1 solute carrier family 50 (sugar transporter) [Trypanosoma rangeli]|eukprot:RNF12911.1 solute carrier family 50 (sugar transporter) [Trypanosoma rangeli]
MPTAASIVSAMATIATIGMVGSPVVTVRKMEHQRSVGIMTPTFFCAQLVNCVMWSIYGVLRSSLAIVVCGVVGNAVATYCLLVFLAVARLEEKSGHRLASTTYKKSLLSVTFALCAIAGVSALIVVLAAISPHSAAVVNGLLGACTSVYMLGSPLALAGAIVKNKNAEGLAPITMGFGLANASLWVLSGALVGDFFIVVPNVLGALACCLQFALLFRYGRRASEAVAVKTAIAPLPFTEC